MKPGNIQDIALINLADVPPNFTTPLVNMDLTVSATTAYGRAIGFGSAMVAGANDSRRREVELPLVDMPRCKTRYRQVGVGLEREVICADSSKGRCDTCQEDSGSPLVQFSRDRRQVLVSCHYYMTGAECAWISWPVVYTRVSLVGWMGVVGTVFERAEGTE